MKYLIWDFDGTLGYREGAWTGAMVEILRRYAPDCAATADHLRPHIQNGFRWHEPHQVYPVKAASRWWADLEPIFERAYQAVGIAPTEAKELTKQVRHVYVAPANWRLYDDTLPILTQLSEAGWTHLLLSNHVPELSALLRHLQVDGFFAQVFNSAETGYEKPHPQAYYAVLKATAGAEQVWMIGDSFVADIAGAAAAGIPGILVRRQHGEAFYQCDDLTQLTEIIQSTLSPRIADAPIGKRTDWQ